MKKTLRLLNILAGIMGLFTFSLASPGGELWSKYCQKCHGADGSGDTMMGQRLEIPDYRDPAVQEAMTDEAIRKAIVEGKEDETGRRVMLAFGKRLDEEEVDALVTYVRSLANE